MKISISFLCCFLAVSVHSQNHFDIAKINYTNTPLNNFETSNGKTQVEELAAKLDVPIVINNKTTILTGVFANNTKVKFDVNTSPTNLSVLGLKLGVNKEFNDKWAGTFFMIPKIASSDISLLKENLQLAFLSIFTNTKTAQLKYKYGLYVNTEKYGLLFVPLLGCYYKSKNKQFTTNLYLPIMGDLNYQLKNKMWLGMKFDGLSTTYNLNHKNYTTDSAYASKISNELVSYLRFQLSKSIYLNTKAGYAISRSYHVFDNDDKIKFALGPFNFDDNRTKLNERFKDGAIFCVELLYRFHFD